MTNFATADVDAVLAVVFPNSMVSNKAGARKANQDEARNDLMTGTIGAYLGGKDCGAPGTTALKVNSKIGGLLGKAAAADPEPISKAILGIATFVSGIVGKIFGHHAAAVQKERGTLCQIVPEVDAALDQIDADYHSGKLSPSAAKAELEQVKQGYYTGVSGIIQNRNPKSGGSDCNAACVIGRIVDGEVLLRENKYSGGLPYYARMGLIVGAVALAGFLIFRGIRA